MKVFSEMMHLHFYTDTVEFQHYAIYVDKQSQNDEAFPDLSGKHINIKKTADTYGNKI